MSGSVAEPSTSLWRCWQGGRQISNSPSMLSNSNLFVETCMRTDPVSSGHGTKSCYKPNFWIKITLGMSPIATEKMVTASTGQKSSMTILALRTAK